MTLREELQSKKDALYALKERIEADDAEAITEGEQLKADIEAKTAELRQAEKKAALLGVIGAKEKEDTSMSDVKARSLGENFVNFVKTSDQARGSICPLRPSSRQQQTCRLPLPRRWTSQPHSTGMLLQLPAHLS